MHPLILFLTLVVLFGALSTLRLRHASWFPWLFAGSALLALARAGQLGRRERRSRASRRVDHAALRRLDFAPYVDWLKENVRGHDAVVDAVGRALQRGLELSRPGRSLGSFLLVGPTGTGKTFLALMTAKALWPEHEPVTLRMSQYKSPEDLNAIFGSPGALGMETPGALTGPVLEQPHRVVLLDEIDKCHREVLQGFLDALDGGRCRDKATGRMVDFSGCVFFATSNAGTDGLHALEGADARARMARARDVLARDAEFDRSFLARFSEILLMDTLAPVRVAEIVCLLVRKQWREQGIEVSFLAPELLAEVVRVNEEFGNDGVRQLAHCVRRMTDALLEEARQRGLSRVALGLRGGSAALLAEPGTRSLATP